jgi:predicted Zn-dependent peptidase
VVASSFAGCLTAGGLDPLPGQPGRVDCRSMNRITTRRLECGLPLIVEEMDGVKSAGLSWLIPAGTACEPEDRQGMATVTAELLMRGAGALNSRQHADALDRIGVGRSTDVGTYHVRIAATMLGDRALDALPLIVDMVRQPRMDAESFIPARDLALQSLESLQDDPRERAVVAARSRHFQTPFNRSPVGTHEGLTALTRDEIAAMWERHARPQGSILAFAGAVRADQLAARLDELLAGWSGAAPDFTRGAQPVRGYAHETDQTNQVQVLLIHDAPAEPQPDSMLEKVAISVLSGGMSGRLFTEVREKRGLCYSVSAGYSSAREFGSVMAYVGTTPERAQLSLDVLLAELERINTPDGAVTPNELARAKVGMKSRIVFSGESTSGRAGALAYDFHRLGRSRSMDEIESDVERVTLDDLNAYLARRRLGPLTIQTLGPAALVPPERPDRQASTT